eukprot:748817-Hanusia_phi.AAC.1
MIEWSLRALGCEDGTGGLANSDTVKLRQREGVGKGYDGLKVVSPMTEIGSELVTETDLPSWHVMEDSIWRDRKIGERAVKQLSQMWRTPGTRCWFLQLTTGA